MDYRQQGKKALSTVLNKEKNIYVIENHIYNNIISRYNEDEEIKNNYNRAVYQIVGDILNKEKLQDVLNSIKNSKLGWKHNAFIEWENQIDEQDRFIETPFIVEEGIIECKKCKSKRVFYYQRQVRSSDEGFSLFCFCQNCKAKWREN